MSHSLPFAPICGGHFLLEFRTQKQWHILRKEVNTITRSGIHQLTAKKTYVRKALGTRDKDVAQKMIKELQELELLGKVDPFAPGFDPKEALKGDQPTDKKYCATARDVLDMFYSAKQHLSPATVDAYKRALEHFIELNGLEKASPKSITIRQANSRGKSSGISRASATTLSR